MKYSRITNQRSFSILITIILLQIIYAYAFVALTPSSFKSISINSNLNKIKITQIFAKVARTEEDEKITKVEKGTDKMMNLPYSGLVGYEPNNLFYEPIDISDPLRDTNDLPGADGSDEKIEAIQQRIQQRVEALKAAGEWDDEYTEFGKDPLVNLPIWQGMIMQLKSCKPFESVDELALTYLLVLLTTFATIVYLAFLRDSLDTVFTWYLNTDFDSDFITNLFKNGSN